MSRPQRPYARLYLDITDDPRWADLWDPAHAGAFLMLTVEAEKAYPSSALIPREVPDEVFGQLDAAGIVTRRPHHHFDLNDLPAERERRAAQGRPGGLARGLQRGEEANASERERTPAPLSQDEYEYEDEDEDQERESHSPTAAAVASTATEDTTTGRTSDDTEWGDHGKGWDIDGLEAAWTERGQGFEQAPKAGMRDALGRMKRTPGVIVGWVRDAPAGSTPYQVIGYCIRQDNALQGRPPPLQSNGTTPKPPPNADAARHSDDRATPILVARNSNEARSVPA